MKFVYRECSTGGQGGQWVKKFMTINDNSYIAQTEKMFILYSMRYNFRVTMLHWCLSLILVSCWFTAAACAPDSTGGIQQGGNVVILQKADSGRPVEVKSGDVVQIELGGSGGTGYWWYVTKIDSKYLELISETTNPNPDPKLMGGPTKGIWRFTVKEPGTTELVMKYYRVWEGPEKSSDQFAVTLNIH